MVDEWRRSSRARAASVQASLERIAEGYRSIGGITGFHTVQRLVKRLRKALPSGARPEVVVMLLPKLMMEKCPQLVVGTAQRVMVGQAREILEEAFDQGPKAFAGNGSGSKPPETPETKEFPTHNADRSHADDKNRNEKGEQSVHMLGRNGTQVSSKTTWKNGKTERIDVENPAPGERPGQIHYHDENNNKYYYDIDNNIFYDQKTGKLAPNSIQKKLKNKDFMKGIKKALEILGETDDRNE